MPGSVYPGAVIYQSFTEPVPPAGPFAEATQLDKYQPRFPDRNTPRKRATFEGLAAVIPQSPIDLVASQYQWRGAFADSVARRKRPVDEGLSAVEIAINLAVDLVTLDKWRGSYADRADIRSKRATFEGLIGSDPFYALAEIGTYRWRGGFPDTISKRKRPVGEGFEAFDPYSSLHVIEVLTSDKWTGDYPDIFLIRPRALDVGLHAFGPIAGEWITWRILRGLARHAPIYFGDARFAATFSGDARYAPLYLGNGRFAVIFLGDARN